MCLFFWDQFRSLLFIKKRVKLSHVLIALISFHFITSFFPFIPLCFSRAPFDFVKNSVVLIEHQNRTTIFMVNVVQKYS